MALPRNWSNLGRSESSLWDECQGSGKQPYRTQIDLGEPAFKCSCPSRKFPCKHDLGLYLLLDAEPALFNSGDAPAWVNDWLQSRQRRLEQKAAKPEPSPEAAATASAQARKREEKREDKYFGRGPPEADELLRFAGAPGLVPPVALLVYPPAAPQRAMFYPFAEYSPEWQAIRYANLHAVPVRFCDLPQAHRLGRRDEAESEAKSEAETGAADGKPQRIDPLRWLAEAAGYGDTETWWDHLVEQRSDSLDLFSAIAEMMTVMRQETGSRIAPLEAQREAYMRNAIRQALKQGHERIAVVCGAWHVPALATLPSAKSDTDLLKGLPKEKVAATWVPWSHGRLTFASGYGAGVTAPGWYRHLWRHRERASLYWLTEVATLLRGHDLDASPAHVIEASRLADTLAALRDRPRPDSTN